MYKSASVVKKYLKTCSRGLCNCFSAEYVSAPLPRSEAARYLPLSSPGITLLRGSADGASSRGHNDGPAPLQGSSAPSRELCAVLTLPHTWIPPRINQAHQLGTPSPGPWQPDAVLAESAYSEWPALRKNIFTSSSWDWTMCSEEGKVFLSAKINIKHISSL